MDKPGIPVTFFYIKEQKMVSIQISSLVFVQLPFELLEAGYKEMKEKHESKIITQ